MKISIISLCCVFILGCNSSRNEDADFGKEMEEFTKSLNDSWGPEEQAEFDRKQKEFDKRFFSIPSEERLYHNDPEIRRREILIRRVKLVSEKTTYEEVKEILGKPDEENVNDEEGTIILVYHPAKKYDPDYFSLCVYIDKKSELYIWSDD